MLLAVSGKPEIDKYGTLSFTHPEIDIIEKEDSKLYAEGAIIPKYKLSDKMRKVGISLRVMRTVMKTIMEKYILNVHETLPRYILDKLDLAEIHYAISNLHFPSDFDSLDESRRRIKFDEIFYYKMQLTKKKIEFQRNEKAVVIKKKSSLAREVFDSLPFKLTSGQSKALREIDADFRSGSPMNRLLQGDVGSGKTIVAVLSALMAIDSGLQVAFLAPTEILAEQHYHSVTKLLEKVGIHTAVLTGSIKGKKREALLTQISSGEIKIVFGTHALFQKDLVYNNLGYLIIDEQHRFGVAQRSDLIDLAAESMPDETQRLTPHVLVMSATPIPRTLTMTVYGDLDVSLIKTKPRNRIEIQTRIAYNSQRASVYEFIRTRISSGEQAFIVMPLVESSEKLDLKAATEEHERLSTEVFPDLKCGLLHGKMKWKDKEDIMRQFLAKEYDILVATTVIEVGIDIPNATVMLIENPERFGLSQLHQLRGRVGRSNIQSYCILMTDDKYKYWIELDAPLMSKPAAAVRLSTLRDSSDGFKISEIDMKLRGPGDLLGVKQAGIPEFKYLNLSTDTEIIESAVIEVESICADDPNLIQEKNSIIKSRLDMLVSSSNYMNIA